MEIQRDIGQEVIDKLEQLNENIQRMKEKDKKILELESKLKEHR